MGKNYLYSLLFLFIIIFSGSGINNNAWHGVYYPDGCLTCEKDYVYSQAFGSFKDCKTWALNKKSRPEDKVVCNKNCKTPNKYGTQTCEEVIRSWDAFGSGTTLEKYKE